MLPLSQPPPLPPGKYIDHEGFNFIEGHAQLKQMHTHTREKLSTVFQKFFDPPFTVSKIIDMHCHGWNTAGAHQGREAAGRRPRTAAEKLIASLHRRHANWRPVRVGPEAKRCRRRKWPHMIGRGRSDGILCVFVPVFPKNRDIVRTLKKPQDTIDGNAGWIAYRYSRFDLPRANFSGTSMFIDKPHAFSGLVSSGADAVRETSKLE